MNREERKEYMKLYNKKYYEKNHENIKKQVKEYVKNNEGSVKEYKKQYYEKHKDVINKSKRSKYKNRMNDPKVMERKRQKKLIKQIQQITRSNLHHCIKMKKSYDSKVRMSDPEHRKRICRKSWLKNRHKRKDKYIENREKIQKRNKIWRKNNMDKVHEYNMKRWLQDSMALGLDVPSYRHALTSWSSAIKDRDKCCQDCGSKENLEAHHILSRKDYPEFTFVLANGITVCKPCHYEYTWGSRKDW